MSQLNRKTILLYEIVGMVFIIFLGSALHFTFDWLGRQAVIGVFSAVNESVWEHLKLAFWPSLFFLLIEYALVRKQAVANFFSAKAAGTCLMILLIPAVFYSYTAVTGESIFAVDISTFIVAVIIGQIASYKMLTGRRLPKKLNLVAIAVLALLAVAFAAFTFYPPHLEIFKDAVTGGYGIA